MSLLTLSLVNGSDPVSAALPDLTIWSGSVNPQVTYRTFASSDCEVVEGCATPGTRRLINFTSEIRNVGSADLVLGRPEGNPLFVWAPCHGHYHFEGVAEYRLLDDSGNVVVFGRKMAFCIEDTYRWRATASAAKRYSCGGTQGLQQGWADVYDAAVPCQWVDITGLPGGNYVLELVIDPDNRILEDSESNNITRVPVSFPSDCLAPANDVFVNARVVTGVSGTAAGPNVCATKEAGEPNHAGNAGGHSIWYRWTAPLSGSVVIATVGSDFDTLLGVYTGSTVGSLTLVTANDDIVPEVTLQSHVTFKATAGTTYHVAVDGWNGAVGNTILTVNPPLNDAFADCQAISSLAGQVTGHNVGATKQTGETAHAGNIGGHSVWYCWTAPTNALMTFDTVGSSFDTLLALYTGSSVGALTLITSNDDTDGDQSRVTFGAIRGTNYRIAVDGFAGSTGTITLSWAVASRIAIRRLGTNVVELTVQGAPGEYQLHRTTSLTNWSTLATFTLSGGEYRYTNQISSAQHIYYRAARMR
ncbi:MAG: hypothetical protein L0Y58_15960 [Verrucomicrobia subdivision 3 bacterium]|nr:hypothetical protein [Limisphaerales bacterium]